MFGAKQGVFATRIVAEEAEIRNVPVGGPGGGGGWGRGVGERMIITAAAAAAAGFVRNCTY